MDVSVTSSVRISCGLIEVFFLCAYPLLPGTSRDERSPFIRGGCFTGVDLPTLVWDVWEAETTRALFLHCSVSGRADPTGDHHV